MNDIIESVDDGAVRSGLDRVRVLGLGGCGCNTVSHLSNYGLKGPKLIACNSDRQALDLCPAPHKIVLGPKCTFGTGCGGDPALGARAAEESIEAILEAAKDAQIVFVTAGMGGGTGTGAAPVVAKAISELPMAPIQVAVILLPFAYEARRLREGKQVLAQLSEYCSSVIPVYNDRLVKCYPKAKTTECLRLADEILLRAVASVTDLVQNPGVINLDMRDIINVLSHRGQAVMGCGEAAGEDRVDLALQMAISSPLMADQSIRGAKALLVNITSDDDILMSETAGLNEKLSQTVGEDCLVFSGMAVDNDLKESGKLKVTVIATGLELEESIRAAAPIVFVPEPEPEIIMAPEPSLTVVEPAAPLPAPEPEPQTVRRRVIKLGAGGKAASSLRAPREDERDDPIFMRNRQD
jgi:cell division protein FtsZ